MRFLFAACSMVLFSTSVFAESSLGREDVEAFCAEPGRAAPPAAGTQFDGVAANDLVMKLPAGRYDLPENAAVLLFENGSFIVRVKDYYRPVNGTDGDDMLAPQGLVGGCSREQLSEVMAKNELDAALLKP